MDVFVKNLFELAKFDYQDQSYVEIIPEIQQLINHLEKFRQRHEKTQHIHEEKFLFFYWLQPKLREDVVCDIKPLEYRKKVDGYLPFFRYV